MRIAEYKQISTRMEQRVVHHETETDENGNIIAEAWDETVEVKVPVMGMVYRDATPEEEEACKADELSEEESETEVERLHREVSDLREALEALLEGVTE